MPRLICCLALSCCLIIACGQHYEEGAHPPPKPPPQAQMPAEHPPATKQGVGTAIVSGTVQLADGLDAKIGAKAALFIIARPAPVGGPPLAVKRLDVPEFPFEFSLLEGDAMMGQGMDWSEIDALYLSAKVDADGSIGGAKTGDLEGIYTQNPVAPGATDVAIVIDTVH